MNDLSARVRPIVGWDLPTRRVALYGLPAAAPLVTYLATSGVTRWLAAGDGSPAPVADALRRRFGPAHRLDWQTIDPHVWPLAAAAADLALVVDAPQVAADLPLTTARLHVTRPGAGQGCMVSLALPGETLPPSPPPVPGDDPWAWPATAPLAAGLARGMLLRETAFGRADLCEQWAVGVRQYVFGAPGDPLDAAALSPGDAWPVATRPGYCTPPARRGRVLIVGLGSLGSVAAYHLAARTQGLVLVDPDVVTSANLPRQSYTYADLGRYKATALAAALTPYTAATPLVTALRHEEAVADMAAAYGVSAALVTTGTADDFAIAAGLRHAGIPHVVGRCYPRARYWEAILVEGDRGPDFASVRGTVTAGPWPPPTPEERAAYGAVDGLVAEPATLVESGWAAVWLARLTVQLATPVGLREAWCLRLPADGATCLVGGVGVEPGADGPAYGVTAAGQVRAWRPDETRVAGNPY